MKSLQLASIFQNNMILQRNKPVNIWGEGPNGLSVTAEICGYSSSAVIRDHKWNCILPPLEACTGETLWIHADDESILDIKLSNISVGDIWIAGGQSNMEYFLRYEETWKTTKTWPLNPNIRMYNCPRLAFAEHCKDTSDSGFWFQEHDSAWEFFSAPGYAFARSIQPVLNVPIGIIGCNWGGTTASAWIDESWLEEEPLSIYLKDYENALKDTDPELLRQESLKAWAFEDSSLHQKEWAPVMYGINQKEQEQWLKDHAKDPVVPMGPYHQNRPGGLFHQMVEKIAPFTVKGVLWYQGESDSNYPHIYDKLFTSMIECWRAAWEDSLPFLFVQLAPFGKWLHCDSTNYPLIREKQEYVSKTVPDTAMASIMDLGMYEDIHPKKKMEVGRRLALLARGMVYHEDILCRSPEFYSAQRNGTGISLKFIHTGEGLLCSGETINGLQIIQNEENCFISSIRIEGDTVFLVIPGLSSSPCKISFAETGYVEVNLFNSISLPLKPFHCIL